MDQGENGFKRYISFKYGYQTAQKTSTLQVLRKRRARLNNKKVFLIRCRNNKLNSKGYSVKVPSGISERPTVIHKKEKFQQALIREDLQNTRTQIWRINRDIRRLVEVFAAVLCERDFEVLMRITKRCEDTEFQYTKRVQTQKFDKLRREKAKLVKEWKEKREKERCGNLNVSGVIRREVVDLTKDGISDNVRKFLNLGPDFAMTPRELPVEQYIAATEEVCKRMEDEQNNGVRTEQQKLCDQEAMRKEVQDLLIKGMKKPVRRNLSKDEWKGKVETEKDEKRVFLPADKGKGMVVMDKYEKDGGEESYETKMRKVLDEMKAKKLTRKQNGIVKPWDLTDLKERSAGGIIKKLVSNKEISEGMGRKLKPLHCHAPKIKGLPKVHKEGVPLRGVVDMKGTNYDSISKFLVPILRKLQGRTSLYVANSGELKRKVETWEINGGEIIMELDVKNMYPSIPVKSSLELVRKRLEETTEWKEVYGGGLTVGSVMSLLEWIYSRMYCEFWGEIYELDCGPIGLGVTGEVARIYMEDFQIRALEACEEEPMEWIWYVDDSQAVVKDEEHGRRFCEHLNQIEPGIIEFTMEFEDEGKVAMLDLNQERKEGGGLTFSVYYKKTNTNIMIKKRSNHAPSVKKAVMKSFVDRAFNLCSETKKEEELMNVKKMFVANGYDYEEIEKVVKERIEGQRVELGAEQYQEQEEREQRQRQSELGNEREGQTEYQRDQEISGQIEVSHEQREQGQNKELKYGTSVEYLKGVSEGFKRIMGKYGYRVALKSGWKIKDMQSKAKTPLGDKRSCVNYEIGCKCGKVVYKGETKRRFEERKKEHEDRERLTKRDLALGDEEAAKTRMGFFDAGLTKHAIMDCSAGIDWSGAKIMCQEGNLKRRKTRESIETMKEDIKGERKTLNRCEQLHEGYRPVLKNLIEKRLEEEKKRLERERNRLQGGVESI